jgi:LmbE family N-acetylglucosaminyl deacetylase
MPASSITHIYLSPHLDDAVFSCGSLLHRQAQAGARTVVVTVCTGNPPPGPLSLIAEELHQRWASTVGLDRVPAPAEITAARRKEDLEALEALGAQAVHLDIADCIYRQNPGTSWAIYPSESSLFGSLHASDMSLVRRVADKLSTMLRGFGRQHLYVPLGIGQHVDHQLARRAAESAGGIYAYYEDYPYVERAGTRWPDRNSSLLAGKPVAQDLIAVDDEDIAAQLESMGRYVSQVGSFWAGPTGMADTLRAFALRTGGGKAPAVRLWRVGA